MGNIFKAKSTEVQVTDKQEFNTITVSAKAPSLRPLCTYCNGPTQCIDLLTTKHDSPFINKYYCKPCGKTIDAPADSE